MNLDCARPLLWIIIPCFNEEDVLPITAKQFLEALNKMINEDKISGKSRILFVNDGSTDSTWDIICNLSINDEHFIGISQSRNRGHQSSLLAGLMEAKDCCDVTISIDCDGQDDIYVMDQMIDDYLDGSEVVYGVRDNRDTDSFFKRLTARSYYRALKAMGCEVVYDHADYRLISDKVLSSLAEYEEVNLFLRGMIPLVGYKSSKVYYKRKERVVGESHYPINKMIHLAVDGITSLSIKPINIISGFGTLISVVGFIGIIWAIVGFLSGNTVPGWASTVCIVCFMGGIQLLSIGVLGQYIGKTYLETKRRPRFIISEKTWKNEERLYKG